MTSSWRSFVEKSLKALLRIAIHHVAGHGLSRELVGRSDTHLELLIEQGLAQPNRHRRLFSDFSAQLQHLGLELISRHRVVEQTLLHGGGRVDKVSREQHLHGTLAGHVARQAHAGCGAEQTVVNARHRKAGGVCRYRQVTHTHQLTPRCRGNTLNLGDHRLRQLLELQHHARTLGKQVLVKRQLRVASHLTQVVTGAERTSAGSQHHHAALRVIRHLLQSVGQGGHHLGRQRIEAVRSIQGQAHHVCGGAIDQYPGVGIRGHAVALVPVGS